MKFHFCRNKIITTNIALYIDLQFSTDDEEFEEVVGDIESVAATLGQGEALSRSAQPVNYMPGMKYFRDFNWNCF